MVCAGPSCAEVHCELRAMNLEHYRGRLDEYYNFVHREIKDVSPFRAKNGTLFFKERIVYHSITTFEPGIETLSETITVPASQGQCFAICSRRRSIHAMLLEDGDEDEAVNAIRSRRRRRSI